MVTFTTSDNIIFRIYEHKTSRGFMAFFPINGIIFNSIILLLLFAPFAECASLDFFSPAAHLSPSKCPSARWQAVRPYTGFISATTDTLRWRRFRSLIPPTDVKCRFISIPFVCAFFVTRDGSERYMGAGYLPYKTWCCGVVEVVSVVVTVVVVVYR